MAHEDFKKKQDVPKFFQALAELQDTTRFEPRDFAAGGDYVYCTVSLGVTYKRNHKKLTIDNAMHRFKFKNGKVVDWHGTEDTARTSAAYNAAAA